MSELRKTTPDELYFITMTVCGWIEIFSRQIYKDILIESFQYCQKNEGLDIFSYVIMPNHIHMICRRQNADLSELLGRFKSFTSKEILKTIKSHDGESRRDWMLKQFQEFAKQSNQYSEYHLWQYTNHPLLLYSKRIIAQKRNYIHQNPVKAGIVNDATAYLYSSACADSPLKVLDL